MGYPQVPILINKIDAKSAYRRCDLRGVLAVMSITTLDDYAILILRQTFGGAFGPFDFTDIASEPITHLGNDMLSRDDWDKEELCSPHIESITPPLVQDTSLHFGIAREADVVVPAEKYGKLDDFIDDIISVGCFNPRWKRLAGVALLSLHIVGQPISKDEPLLRDDLVALKKLQAEGQLSEQQTVLGWDINSRLFIISLLDVKYLD